MVIMSRLDNGAVMCGICFEYRMPDQLHRDPEGQIWDLCEGRCAEQAGFTKKKRQIKGST